MRDGGPRSAHAPKGVLEAVGGVFILLVVHTAATTYADVLRPLTLTTPLPGEPMAAVSVLS